MIPHSKPALGAAEQAAAARVLESGLIAQGREVEAFEAECAAYLGWRRGVAVNSGTSALHLALAALGADAQTDVALPAYACAALMTAVGMQGARPVLGDVGDDLNLDPGAVPPQTPLAIVPHLFGAPARFPEGPAVIEDTAQCMRPARRPGAACAITSFYATKLLTTGEGGMVVTDDEAMAEYVRDRRDYDNRDDFIQRYPYKMTDLQAAIGRVQLRRLPELLARRRAVAAAYAEGLADLPLGLPDIEGHSCFRYVVRAAERDRLEAFLAGRGVEAKRPVYRPAHHYVGGNFPRAEAAHANCLSLPIYPALLETEIKRVIDSVRAYFD